MLLNQSLQDTYESKHYNDNSGEIASSKRSDSIQEVPVENLSDDDVDQRSMVKSMVNTMAYDNEGQKLNEFFGVITVMKTIIGSGILGLSITISQFSVLLGTLIFLFIYVITQYTCYLLLKSKNITGHSNYNTIGLVTIGKWSKYFIAFFFIFGSSGICMAELIIFGKTIYKNVDKSSDKKMKRISLTGLTVSLLIYLTVGVFGYLSFPLLKDDPKDLLSSFKRIENGLSDPLYVILNSSFVISSTLSFPVIFFGAKNNLISLFKNCLGMGRRGIREKQSSSVYSEVQKFPENVKKEEGFALSPKQKRHLIQIALKIGLFCLVVLIAILVGELGPIFNIVGAVSSNAIGYILPALFYIGCAKKKDLDYQLSWILLVFGTLSGIFCVVSEFLPK